LLFDSFNITTIKQKHRVKNLKPTWRLSQGVYWYKLTLHNNHNLTYCRLKQSQTCFTYFKELDHGDACEIVGP
jgi:hypothetical protein